MASPARREGFVAGATREHEADRIYRAIFGSPAPEIVRLRFARASDRLDERFDRGEVERYYEMIRNVEDLEALEIACRHFETSGLLSAKFHIMIYIAETLPENQRFLVNLETAMRRAVTAMVIGGARSVLKLCKGLVLLRRVKR